MTNLRNPVGWFEIYVQDMDRARAFYENTFDVQLQPLESPDLEMLTFPSEPDRPGCGGALVKMDGKDSGTGGTINYFSCLDCSIEAGRALESGGQIQKEKMSIGEYGFISLVIDTEGNMIGLHSLQ